MVISGVAEEVPERIQQLIYLDAMVPRDDESAKDVCGELWNQMMVPHIRDSVMLYPFGTTAPVPPTDVQQPINTFLEKLRVTNPMVKKIPTAFIVMTKDGKTNPATEQMGLARAKERNWKIYTFEGGHYSMREQPARLVEKIKMVLRK